MKILIMENLVIVNEKPYHASEVFIDGKITGYISISKTNRVNGLLQLEETPEVSLESNNVLVIGNRFPIRGGYNIKIHESRKGFIVDMVGKILDKGEIRLELDRAQSSISLTYHPLRLIVVNNTGSIELAENPFVLNIKIRSPERVSQARVE